MSIYIDEKHKHLDWALVEACFQLKEHVTAPKTEEKNVKKKRSLASARGKKTAALKKAVCVADNAINDYVFENDPSARCGGCGLRLATHKSQVEAGGKRCFTCIRAEPGYEARLLAEAEA